MEVGISLFITIALILLGFIRPKSKIIFTIQIVWMWILIGLNNGGTDFPVYKGIFYQSNEINIFDQTDGLLYTMYYIFKNMGQTLILANAFLTLITLFFIFIKIPRFSNKYSMIGSLMLMYPLFDNVIQKKNFFASGLIILAFFILFDDKCKYKKIISFCLILVATRIHSSCIIYFIFWLLSMLDIEKIKKILPYLLVIAFVAIPVLPKIASIFIQESKVELYFYTLKISSIDSLLWMILHSVFTFIIHLIHKQSTDMLTKDEIKYENNVYKLNLILLLMLPFYYYEPTFIRIYRNLMIFNYILIANRQTKITTKSSWYMTIAWVSYIIIISLTMNVFLNDAYSVKIVSSCTHNLFLKFLIGG